MITIKQIKELANNSNHKGYRHIGIRVQDGAHGLIVGQTVNHCSNIWDDGTMTEAKLNGICAVKVQKVQNVVNRMDNYSGYDGDTVIVLGSEKAKKGYDKDEIIMVAPVVLEIIKI